MNAVIYNIPINPDGTCTLPPEVMQAFAHPEEIYLSIDPVSSTASLSATHPETLAGRAAMDQLAALYDGVPLEEYGEPVPESFLKQRGKGERSGGGA